MRQVKRKFEELIVKRVQAPNKNLLKDIWSRKLLKETVRPLEDQGLKDLSKGGWRDCREVRLIFFFWPQTLFSGESEKQSKIVMTKDDILDNVTSPVPEVACT